MTHRVKVQLGGASGATVHDFSDQVQLYNGDGTPAIHGGGQVDDGAASVGEFILTDDEQAIEIPYGTTAVTSGALQLASRNPFWWTEDSPGYESWLSAGWIDLKDIGRFGHRPGDSRVFRASWQDMNAELRGIPLLAKHTRPEETDVERVQWVIDTFYNGDKRPSTVIETHLIGTGTDSAAITMPAKVYEAGSAAVEIIEDCATTAGKIFGVVRHDLDSATHKCLLYIGSQDYDTYTTAAKISDEIADWDPTDATAPVFEPHWMQEAAVSEDPTNMVSGIVSRWSGGVVNYISDTLRDIYNYYVESYSDDQSVTEAQATARASAMTLSRSPEHITHMPSVLISPSQHPLLREGMSIQIKSRAAMGGQYAGTYRTRRIAKVNYEPAGTWNGEPVMWAHLELDRPEWRVPANQGKPIIPKPAETGGPVFGGTCGTDFEIYQRTTAPGGEFPCHVADGDDTNFAQTAAPVTQSTSWFAADLFAAKTVSKVRLVQGVGATSAEMATAWALQGSSDWGGSTSPDTGTWTTVASFGATGNDSGLLSFAAATYRYWRIKAISGGGGGWTVNEWEMSSADDTVVIGGPGEGTTGDGGYIPGGSVIEHGDLSGKGGTMHDATQIEVTPFGTIAATNVQDALEEIVSEATGGSDDQTAAEVPFTPAGTIAATDTQAAVEEVATDAAAALSAHISDTTDAHDASAVSIADAGAYFTGTDVEAALQELGAGGGGGGSLTVEEVDGSPTDSAVTKLVFPNGTLGITSHVATYTPAGGGGGGGISHAYVGASTSGASWVTPTTYRWYMKKITLAADGALQNVAAYVRGTDSSVQSWHAAVFDDVSGSPKHVIAGPGAFLSSYIFLTHQGGTGDGRWLAMPMGLWLPAGSYWLAVMTTGGPTTIAADLGSGSDRYFSTGGSGVPLIDAGFFTVTTSSDDYSIRGSVLS